MSTSPCHHVRFATWGEFLYACEYGKSVCAERHSRDGRASWAGGSFTQALRWAKEGWREGVERLDSQSKPIFERITGMIERYEAYYSEEGTQLDVARYLDNEPECWVRMESVISQGAGLRLIRLVYNIGVSGGVEKEVIEARGVAVASLVECLEYAGHRVQVDLAMPASSVADGAADAQITVRLKEFDQAFDHERFAYAIIHPTVLRRLIFSIMEQFSEHLLKLLTIPGSYGKPTDVSEDTERGDIYIGQALLGAVHWTSVQAASQWILDTLKAQGVSIQKGG